MANTSNSLSLPFIQPSQAQKHVTHNDALQILDTLTQLAVVSDETTAPPSSPSAGNKYIIAPGGTGDWASHDGEVAVFEMGGWRFFVPRAGWRAFVLNREALVVFDGGDWIDLDSDDLQDITSFGLGMSAPATTPFSAKLNNALWTALYQADAGSGDLIKTVNKEAQTNDGGVVFQTDFETRAILGLFGTDAFRLAVSPDGNTFFEGLRVDQTSGIVDIPNLPRCKATTNYDNYCTADTWTRIALNASEFNDQNAFDASANRFTAPVDGTFSMGATLTFKENTTDAVTTTSRFLKNGTDVLSGSQVANSGPHISEVTTLHVNVMAALVTGDTIELEGRIGGADGYFMADQTVFWAHKVG